MVRNEIEHRTRRCGMESAKRWKYSVSDKMAAHSQYQRDNLLDNLIVLQRC